MSRSAVSRRSRAPSPSCLAPAQLLYGGASVAVLGSVIVVHELGHFAAARLQTMRVSEFSIGFGPVLLERKREGGEVAFVLRALPIGGFVGFPRFINETALAERGVKPPPEGAPGVVYEADDPDLLENRPFAQQALVVSAGVAANLVLAWACLFSTAASVGVPSLQLSAPIGIARVVEGSSAAAAGVRAGDALLELDGRTMLDAPDPLLATTRAIRASVDARRPLLVTVEREGQRLPPLRVLPTTREPIGVELSAQITGRSRRQLPPLSAATSAATETRERLRVIAGGVGEALGSLLPGSSGGRPVGVSGPLGIVKMGSEIAQSDAAQLLDFAAVLSLNLAVFNTLPLPGLDGFQLLLLSAEAALGRKLGDDFKAALNFASLLLFVGGFSTVLLGDLAALGPAGSAFASGVRAALTSGAVAIALLALLGALRRGLDARQARASSTLPGNAFLYPDV